MKKIVLFSAVLCAALYRQGWRCRNALAGIFASQKLRSVLLASMLIALIGCKGKTAQTSGSKTQAGQAADSGHLDAAQSPTREKLTGTYWTAVEFINQESPLEELRLELFLFEDSVARFLLLAKDGEITMGFNFDNMYDWTFMDGKLMLLEPCGDKPEVDVYYTGEFKDGRLTMKRNSSSGPIVMEQAAMPPYDAVRNKTRRLYTEIILAAQDYSSYLPGYDPESSLPSELCGAELADLNFDGMPELFLFGPRSEYPQEVRIFTVSGGSAQKIFSGLTDIGDVTLYKKKKGGSLAYSFESASGDWKTYIGTIYLTNANTKMDKTLAQAAKFAEFTITQYQDDNGDFTDPEFTVNGRKASNMDDFDKWKQDIFKEYEELRYTPVVMVDDWTTLEFNDIGLFLNSYKPEGK